MSSDNNEEPRIGTRVTNIECPVCSKDKKGVILEIVRKEKSPLSIFQRMNSPGPVVRWTLVTRYQCSKCGVFFLFSPGSEQEPQEKKVAV